MTSSSTFPAATACRMTSAPPPTAMSPSPAASAAWASAASRSATNGNPVSAAGWSAVQWVSTNRGPGNGLVRPHAPAASYQLATRDAQPGCQGHYPGRADRAVSRLQHLTVALENMVCQECNNTWQSRLENELSSPSWSRC